MALSAGSVEIRLFAELARLQSDMKKANKVVEDAMGGIQKTVRATTSLFNNMAASFGAAQIIKLADDYKRFDAQLKLSTKSLQEYGQAYNNVIRIGRTAQSDIGAIGVLYARLNNNLRDFNVTQNQVAGVTETISLALRTNNATVQETNSVMLQLSQSFGSGKLNGQEFLAVAEGAPMLLRQLAKSLNEPFGALKDLSAQGKITREDLLKAWSDPEYIAALRQQVKEVGTVTSSYTVLMNNLKQYIGESDKATGATKALSGGIMLIADNINVLVSGAIAYGIISLKKWSVAQLDALRASADASLKSNQQLAFNAEMQKLNAEKTVAASNLKQDMVKLEGIAENNKQAAIIKTAEAERAAIIQKIQYNKETLVAIQASRAEAIAANQVALARQNEAIRTLEATRNAATLSGNLFYQRQAEEQLAAAIAKRNALMTELAVLGRQQANVNAQITASTIALQKAEQSLNTTRATGAVTLANNASMTTRMVHDYDKAKGANDALNKSTGILSSTMKGLNGVMAAFGGPVGIAITGIILFGDKLLEFVDKVRGVTPELKKINDQIKRNNELRKIGVSSDDTLAAERESIAKTVAEIARLQETRDRVLRMGKNAGVYMMFSTPAEKIAEIDAQIAQGRKNILDTMNSIDEANALTTWSTSKVSEEYVKLSEKLKTAKELAAEYAANQRLIMIEGHKAGLSQNEILAKLALLKDQYDKATGATKAFKEAAKGAAKAEKLRAEGIKQLVLEQKAFVEAQEDARQAVILDAAQENQALATQIEKTQERIDLLNMGEEAQNRMVEARLQDAIATAEQNVQQAINNGGTKDAIKYAEDYLFALKERLELQKKLSKLEGEEERIKVIKAAEKERVKATKDANAEIERANDRLYSNLARSITDSIVRGFENGLSFIDNFKQAITNAFKSFFVNVGVNFVQGALEQTMGSITKGIFGSIATAVSGSAVAGTDGVAAAGLLDQAKNIFNVVTKGFDAANASYIGGIKEIGQAISNFGSTGSGVLTDAASSLGSSIQLGAQTIGEFLPYAGAIIKLAQGDVVGAAFTGAGVLIGNMILPGIGGVIGGMLGSVVGGLFGGEDIPMTGDQAKTTLEAGKLTTKTGTFGKSSLGGGDALQSANEIFARSLGGLMEAFGDTTKLTVESIYRSRTNTQGFLYVNGKGVAEGAQKGISFEDFLKKMLGPGLSAVIQRSTAIPLAIRDLFKGIKDHEKVQTMIGAVIALNNASVQLSDRFGLTVENAAKLSKETGLLGDDLVAFINKLSGVAQTVKTPAQQILEYKAALTGLLGGSLPATIDAFDSVLKSFDTTTVAGRALFLEMFNLRDAFLQFTTAMDNVKKGVNDAIFGLLTPEQQSLRNRARLEEEFAKFNLAVPKTTQQLIAMGEGIDYTTEAGLTLALAFPTLVQAFQAVNSEVLKLNSALNPNAFRTFTDFVIAKSYAAYGQAIPAANMPSYAVGTPYVPNDGVAMLHRGEAVLTRSENASMSVNSGRMVSLLGTLITKVSGLEYDMKRTADSSQRTVAELEDITGGYVTINTQAA